MVEKELRTIKANFRATVKGPFLSISVHLVKLGHFTALSNSSSSFPLPPLLIGLCLHLEIINNINSKMAADEAR